MKNPFNQILLAAVVVLALGEGYLLYQNAQLRTAAISGGMYAGGYPNESSSTAVAFTPAPTNVLMPLGGTLIGVAGNILTLSGQASSTVKVAVSANTSMVQEGTLKDAAAFQADLDAFHKYSDQLMQDPKKNQAALQQLIAPSRNIETTVSASQLTVGEIVTAFVDGQNTDGVYRAVRIIVAQPGSNANTTQ